MVKRGLSLAMGMLLAVSACFSGCGTANGNATSASSGNTDKASSSAEQTSKASSDLEPATIQIWLGGPGKQKDSDKVWELFNEKLQEYVPNTTVEFTVIPPAEYGESFNQMLASSEPVDLAWIASWVTGPTNQLIQDKSLMPLDDLLSQYGSGIRESLGDTVLDMHRDVKDNKLYYLISWQGLYSNIRAFKVPTELAKLAGDTWVEDTKKVVDTWWNHYSSPDDLQAVFDQLDLYLGALKENGKLYAGIDRNVFGAWLYPYRFSSENSLQCEGVGVQHNDNTFTVIDAIQSDYYKVYAKNMAEFYNKGYIRSDIASLEKGALSFVSNGEFTPNTLVLDVHNDLTDDAAQMYSAQAGTDITLIPIENEGYLSRGDATAMAIPYCADQPERAMMVLNALYTEPELYQLLIYGIEGTHYTDNHDGTITTPYGSQGKSDSDYGLWKWTIGTCKNSLVTQADTAGYYDQLEEKEKTALISSFVNFSWDNSQVTDVLASLTAIDAEYRDMIDKGYTGDNWEETLNQWIEERKAAGVDRVIDDMQQQINSYVQENHITSWIKNR